MTRRDAPDTVAIERRERSGPTNEAGQPTTTTWSTVYEGAADMQPGDSRLRRSGQSVQQQADVTCVLPDDNEGVAWDVKDGDRMTWDGREYRVFKTSPMDGLVFCSRDG